VATTAAGRVIAGTAKGRRLVGPGAGTRPLADRAKQTLFAILEPELAGARFLDLFAGSGAAGIEALSRGAGEAVFVDGAGDAVRAIGTNLATTGLTERATVVRADVLAWLDGRAAAADPFDVVVVDPPFGAPELLGAVLERLGRPARSVLAPEALVAVRSFWRAGPPARAGLLASVRERRIGEAVRTFYRPAPPAEEHPA
jgi:16S rRNA (guanine(966)-N(2))-methyltransferase RsmD